MDVQYESRTSANQRKRMVFIPQKQAWGMPSVTLFFGSEEADLGSLSMVQLKYSWMGIYDNKGLSYYDKPLTIQDTLRPCVISVAFQ